MSANSKIPLTPEIDFLSGHKIGGSSPLFLIAGPCVIENEALLEEVAATLSTLREKHNILIVFKSSFDKANRSSHKSFRGPGIEKGMEMLKAIKDKYSFPILTDIHWPEEAEQAAKVADILQIPAFLSRQSDLLEAAAKTGAWVNVKKGQFMAPLDAVKVAEKVRSSGNDKVLITERGYTFGYNNLVVDMRSFELLRREGIHVIFDATHSTQLPGGGEQSGGEREMAYPLARSAAATGIDGLFMEVHPNPPAAKSDSTNQYYLSELDSALSTILAIDNLIKKTTI